MPVDDNPHDAQTTLATSDTEPSAAREPVFVFGSNLAGRHGKGAALWARQHRGAIYGIGEGVQGNSYAIPTKGYRMETLPLEQIRGHVESFLAWARHSNAACQLTPIGCGLAGYTPDQIAPMFKHAPSNVRLPDEFVTALSQAGTAEPCNSPGGGEP